MNQKQNMPGEDKKKKKKQEDNELQEELQKIIEKAKKILGNYRKKDDCSYCE